jgi:hypothetical protein
MKSWVGVMLGSSKNNIEDRSWDVFYPKGLHSSKEQVG